LPQTPLLPPPAAAVLNRDKTLAISNPAHNKHAAAAAAAAADANQRKTYLDIATSSLALSLSLILLRLCDPHSKQEKGQKCLERLKE
jgi:hypothetical protein